MRNFWHITILGLLPALGILCGAVVAEILPFSQRMLSFALHAAAGVVLSMVAVELMPKALQSGPAWLMVGAFIIGGALFILIDAVTEAVVTQVKESGSESAGSWTIYSGMILDIFSDGIMIGTGAAIHPGLGFILSLGQVVADVPTGFATTASFHRHGESRFRRILLMTSFVIPVITGSFLGYYVIGRQGRTLQLSILAITAGMLATMTIEEIVPQAHLGKDVRTSTVFFILGFAALVLLSAYLGP